MSVTTSVVLGTVRTFLNDDAATNWTDAALMPKLQQAHRELQIKLRRAAAPLMKGTYVETIAAGTLAFVTPPTDLVAPIQLWEALPGTPPGSYTLMTEADPLPNVAATTTMIWWAWIQEVVTFIGSTANRTIKMLYWRAIPIPQANTDLIGFINGELWLAPRTAAIALGSVGETEKMGIIASVADSYIAEVILANRGRAPAAPGASIKP